MFFRSIRAAAPFLLLLAAPAAAQRGAPVTPDDLMRHIRVLASDQYQGRAPATEGERLTTAYIVEQFRARGLEPAGENGSWFQPVTLVRRTPGSHDVRWSSEGRPLAFHPADIFLLGRENQARVADAPVVFAGHGARMPERGIDQLAGAEIEGAVVLILVQGPDIPGFPSLERRVQMATEAGAAAVIVVTNLAWSREPTPPAPTPPVLDAHPYPQILGAMPVSALEALLAAAGGNIERLLNDQPGSSFRSVALPLRVTLEATTSVERQTTNNVIGRIRGAGGTGESVLFLSHWDHVGLCRPEGEPDRICNGAVDNASGIASLIEIAGRLADSPRPTRDILFLATTAEEVGLRGAEYFAFRPTVPAASIVAAINMDSVAIHPAGLPVAMIGRGIAPALDRVVDDTVRAAGRRVDSDDEANVMVQRQDGWKLNQVGIPTIMVSGSFSDMPVLMAFLQSTYHKPNDEVVESLQLGGAAEDADLLVALGRRLADPAVYQRAPGQ